MQRERLRLAWWESLKTLYKTPRLRRGKTHSHILRDIHLDVVRPNSKFQTLSLVAHVALILALIYMPVASGAREVMIQDVPGNAEKIYYRLTVINPQKLPRIAPVGAGAQPGKGDLVQRVPALGSTVRQHNLTVVSRPLRPDNTRQTIFQPIVPPNLRIITELKLPNIVEARPVIVPKPKVALNAKESKPNVPNKRTLTAPAPSLTATNITLTDLTNPTNAQPRLPVPPPSPSDPVPTPTAENAEVGANSPAGLESQTQNHGSGLVVISTDPGQASDMVALPTGNRWADFSISPAGSMPGSPGGTSQHRPSVGTGGGAGGDSSTGIGKGESGGGGGSSGESGSLSVSGTGGGAAAGTLGPGVPLSMVYPVVASLLPRRNALVVSAGPMGGGGLNIYGALKCGKIYTVFLQMPGKAWTLQYCLSSDTKETRPSQTSSAIVHMEQGITPPDAESRFDFKRLPLPEDKVHKLIVLKGSLREDGAVENLQVHQGLLPMMDEAARLAFSQWKFKPATRGGRAIPVDILVGIPGDPVPVRQN